MELNLEHCDKVDANEVSNSAEHRIDNSEKKSTTEVCEQHYFDDNGKFYQEGNNLLPDNTYELNGYEYSTDSEGRIVSAEGALQIKEGERGAITISKEELGKGDEQEDDDRGHVIGDKFNGAGGAGNLVLMEKGLNRGEYNTFERELQKAVESGSSVFLKVEPYYSGNSNRPDGFVCSYSINGDEAIRIFKNEKE